MVKDKVRCWEFISEGSKCTSGMVRCSGLMNCMRQYPALQIALYDTVNYSHCNGQFQKLFKEATHMNVATYRKNYMGATFINGKKGIIIKLKNGQKIPVDQLNSYS